MNRPLPLLTALIGAPVVAACSSEASGDGVAATEVVVPQPGSSQDAATEETHTEDAAAPDAPTRRRIPSRTTPAGRSVA